MTAFTLPLKTVGGQNAREHWRARAERVKRERQAAMFGALNVLFGDDPRPCVVTMTRLSPGTLDDDNLSGSMKAVRDGIADAIGVDDRNPGITWRCEQEKCKRGTFGVRVTIERRAP